MKRLLIIFAAVLCTITLSAQQSNKPRQAVVALSSIYMRVAPSYEAALETQELMGTIVEITGQNRYWREILCPQPYKAWCTNMGIVEMSNEEIEAYKAAPKCMFTDLYGHVYESPSFSSQTMCDLVGGDILRYANEEYGKSLWGLAEFPNHNYQGWTKVLLPTGAAGWVCSQHLKPHEGFTSIAKGEGNAKSVSDEVMDNIIATALKLKGVPYLWGGMTPKGVDCSGLVRWSFLMNGILLPRNASQIVHCGEEVNLKNIQRGDLLFFGTPAKDDKPQRVTHVAIYLGDNRIVHSSHLVRVNSLKSSDPDYYSGATKLVAARRL